MAYQRILCAVDFGEGTESVLKRAEELAGQNSAELYLIHVVEPVIAAPPYELPGFVPMELEQQLLDHAREEISRLAAQYSPQASETIVELGSTRTVITSTARDKEIDLIVLGSHGRHGMGLLLGSTANAVLHHADCDVLAIRIGKNNSD